jgi:hypothetical protein
MVCNFRKTRKRGGVEVSTVLECVGPFRTKAKCLEEFLKQNNFKKYNIRGDGNCFYRTIVKYLQLSQNPELPDNAHLEIRNNVVDSMEIHIEDIAPFLIINNSNNSNNNRNILVKQFEALEALREDGNWSSDTADLVTQYAAKALNVKINIYDFKSATRAKKELISRNNRGEQITRTIQAQPAKFICYTFDPDSDLGVTINMLRVDNSHFELLYPISHNAAAPNIVAPIQPSSNKKIIRKKPKIAQIIHNENPISILNNMRNLRLSNKQSDMLFTSLKKNINKITTGKRKRPLIASNVQLALKLQKEINKEAQQEQNQIEANAIFARQLQEENRASKNKTRRNPPRDRR